MRIFALAVLALVLAACSSKPPPAPPAPTATLPANVKIGKPYRIDGRWYYPRHEPDYDRVGIASWYGSDFHGLETANGEVFDMHAVSAAHTTLPLPSLVRVTNLENGRSLVLRVNDRGPFVGDRIIDLSRAAARELGFERAGLAKVRVQFVGFADDSTRVAAPVRLPEQRPQRPGQPPTVVAAAPAPRVGQAHAAVPAAGRAQAQPGPPSGVPAGCTNGWVVQVGAFRDVARVRAAAAEVSHLHTVQLEPAFAGDQPVVRLRLGPVPVRNEAVKLLHRVRHSGHPAAFAACATRPATLRVS